MGPNYKHDERKFKNRCFYTRRRIYISIASGRSQVCGNVTSCYISGWGQVWHSCRSCWVMMFQSYFHFIFQEFINYYIFWVIIIHKKLFNSCYFKMKVFPGTANEFLSTVCRNNTKMWKIKKNLFWKNAEVHLMSFSVL